ncbi:PucR family transcriptional regulator [Corynebacterium ammoniagenes]|uniref:PucR family transcriptional regulator n=1 Tax=Corynebacterium ammoniagenes TaxID=1697 RepID=UPI001459E0F4|nr:helix-turn-helix domain-containing protein [Corynebacterium ammoniagenes]NMF31990.1 PucR family transcriptional regulator [Corynebacterium ammoniagenes]
MMDAALSGIINELEAALPSLQALTVAEIFSQLDSYVDVTDAELQESISRNMQMAVDSLRAGRIPTPDEVDKAETTTTERFFSGVAVDQVIVAFRMSFSKIHERFIDLALKRLSKEDLTRGSKILSGVSDAFTIRSVSTFNYLQVQSAVADASRRAAALRTILAGKPLSIDEKKVLSINASERYAAIRVIVPEGSNPEDVRAKLEETGSRPEAKAVVVLDDQKSCMGLVAKRPRLQDDAVIGIGPFLSVLESPLSDLVATQAAQLALRIGRTGVQGIEELNWRLVVMKDDYVDEFFRNRFLTPIESKGEFSEELLETVRTWLFNGRAVSRTAEIMHVHQNSVRYRLGKFSELTGFDPENIDDLIGAAWILEVPPRL